MALDQQRRNASQSTCGSSTSRSLLGRLRDNHPEAWERLVALYTPLVYFWCRKLNVREQDIPDIVQEIFKSVALNIHGFRKERPEDTFRGWLRTITRSKSMDHYRRAANQPEPVGGSAAQSFFSQLPANCPKDELDDQQAEHSLFHCALELIRSEFHQSTWQAFWRVVVDGQTPKDVAEELSMRAGTVRVAKCRVLQRLRKELGELLE